MKWWVWLLIAGAVLVIVKRSRGPVNSARMIVAQVGHPDYPGAVMIDSGQGYGYSINPTQNPNAFDVNGNVIGLPAGARVTGAKV